MQACVKVLYSLSIMMMVAEPIHAALKGLKQISAVPAVPSARGFLCLTV